MANILNKLTEGIVNRSVEREGQALLDKWTKTGLLEGLGEDHKRQSMAVLLENQAKELLREANAISDGGVQGFAAVSFPIVRRVFGGLLANDLVSVQPMSLPSGLIFFLDFTRGDTRGDDKEGDSVHGQGKVGSGIVEGVDIGEGGIGFAGDPNNADKGFYNLSQGYSAGRGASTLTGSAITVGTTYQLTKTGCTGGGDCAEALDYDVDLLAEAASNTEARIVEVMTWTNDLKGVTPLVNSGNITTSPLADSLNTGVTGSNAISQFSRNSAMTFALHNMAVEGVTGCTDTTIAETYCVGSTGTWANPFNTQTLVRRLTKATFYE